MRYVAAALLSALGGGDISEAGIKTILDSVGIEYDAEKAKKVMKKFI
jgi:ribosomal protein L12E/L44/L45/RPP1/RPP2